MRQTNDHTAVPSNEPHRSSLEDVAYNNRSNSRIESFQDISNLSFGYYSDNNNVDLPNSGTSARERLGMSQYTPSSGSDPETESSGSNLWTRPFSATQSGAYQQIGNGSGAVEGGRRHMNSIRNVLGGRFTSLRGSASPTPKDIPEGRESQDIALLPAANAIDGAEFGCDRPLNSTTTHRMAVEAEAHNVQVDPRVKEWQKQEQAGHLTGGLGAGFEAPRIQIREADLTSPSSPLPQRTPSRSFSFARKKLSLNRSVTRKALAQNEANRTGQAVQIIVEEPTLADTVKPSKSLSHRESQIDLGFVAGDAMPDDPNEMRDLSKLNTTISVKPAQKLETFYPVPNWKPFSMQWPYLLLLIVLSFLLAGSVEAVYQHSQQRGSLVQFVKPQEIKGIDYFSIKYLPTLVAVIYGVLWQTTEFEVKRLEAYHQLSKEDGARAAETLNVDYTTSFGFLHPYYALRRRHYAVFVVALATILAVSAVPTLISFSIVLSPGREAREANPLDTKFISIHPIWSRLTEAVLTVVALLGCVLFYLLETRRSGLLADVKGIAGLAAMANVSHILMDFKATDVATHEDIHARLKNHRYILRNSSLAPMDDTPLDKNSTDLNSDLAKLTSRYTSTASPDASEKKKYQSTTSNPLPLMFRPLGFIPYIIGIGLFTVFFPICELSDFIDLYPGILTALAVCVKLGWGALDTTTRLMEPFFILYNRHAPPKTLTLDYTSLPFGWAAGQALVDRRWLVAAVGIGTVMTELLTVQVSSLATVEGRAFILAATSHNTEQHSIDAGEETEHTYWLSLVSALCILVYMCVVAIIVYIKRGRVAFVPRQPNTIASVLAFIHQSKMLYDFVGTEKYSNAAMRQHLTDINREYGLGWFEGRDGRTHCGVDQEELSAPYQHGVDITWSNNPWQESFEEWV